MSIASALKRLNPISALDGQVEQRVAASTKAAVRAALEELTAVSPPLGDLLTGDAVEIQATITVRLQLRQ